MSLPIVIDYIFSECQVERINSHFAVLRSAVLKVTIHTHDVGKSFKDAIVAYTEDDDDHYLVCLGDCCSFYVQHIEGDIWEITDRE